jgi:hypothetical protein
MRRASRLIAPEQGKQPEHDFRETERAVRLGDQVIGRQRGFKTAAQRPALHQRNRAHVRIGAGAPFMHDFKAQPRVAEQRLPVAVPDTAAKQPQVAAQAEIVRMAGTHDRVVDRLDLAVAMPMGCAGPEVLAELAQFVQKRKGEIMGRLRDVFFHRDPQGVGCLAIEQDVDMAVGSMVQNRKYEVERTHALLPV